MGGDDFNVLAQRIDGVAWVLTSLIHQLDMDGRLDSAALCNSLRNTADVRGRYPGLDHSAALIRELADGVDAARTARQSRARPA